MNGYPVRPLLVVFGIVLTGSWAASGLNGEALFVRRWPEVAQYSDALTALVSLGFFGLVAWLYKHQGELLSTRILSQGLVRPHACLIMTVSSQRARFSPSDQVPLTVTLSRGESEMVVELHGCSLEEDIKALDGLGQWPWQQLLRGIAPHAETLRKIVLVGSEGPDGSGHYLENCVRLLARYTSADIVTHPTLVDFENIDALSNEFDVIIKSLKKDGISEKEMVIDITGGQKPTSIAAAAVTLNKRTTFQYVRTGAKPNQPRVREYDVVTEHEVKAG